VVSLFAWLLREAPLGFMFLVDGYLFGLTVVQCILMLLLLGLTVGWIDICLD
jgi:hypothetical protein